MFSLNFTTTTHRSTHSRNLPTGTIFLSRDPSHSSRYWPIIVPSICDLPFRVLRGQRINPSSSGFPATYDSAQTSIKRGGGRVDDGKDGGERPIPVWVFNTDRFGWVASTWVRV